MGWSEIEFYSEFNSNVSYLVFDFIGLLLTMIDHSSFFRLCDLPGGGHPISGQPRVEELHPGLHVQRLRPGADSRELLQASKLIFMHLGDMRFV